ncbi:MAG: SusC/RagA family TonB-linked outer membrane protein [Flavobacterium sp.]
MKSKFTWILTLCLAFFIQFSFAQEKTITGTVVSKTDKMSMPGVNVVVQGTTRGVQTDLDGNFSIKASAGQKLVFSFLGSKTQIVPVGSSNVIKVQLEDENVQLGDVVVEGYNITRTKSKSNVSSVTVSAKAMEARPNASFVQSLQSQVAGLNISTGSGQPGASSTVILRGVGSLTGKVEPLYVIDGVPLNSDNFRSLNPDEIESVSILKDAGATSVYGSRAASGVIVVKTKKGGFDAGLKVRYSASTGFSTMQQNKYNIMNSSQLLNLERLKGVGQGAGFMVANGQFNKNWTAADNEALAAEKNTDWTKEFFRTGITQSHGLNLTSGSKTVSSFTSFGYFDQQGILQNTDIKRFSFRSNIDGKSKNERFNYSTNLSVNFSRSNSQTGIGGGGVNQNPILGAFKSVPYISPSEYVNGQDVFDKYKASGTLIYSPLMLMDKVKTSTNVSDEVKAIASVMASYKIAKDWTIGTNFGLDYTQIDAYSHLTPDAFNSIAFFNQNQFLGTEGHSYNRDGAFNWNNRLNWNKKFNQKHSVDVTLFTEYFKTQYNSFGFTQNGLDPKTTSPGSGKGYLTTIPTSGADLYVPTVGAATAMAGLFSYFVVGDYDFDGKYGFGATVRRDASSRFADSNKWGTFFSVSGRWNIDREKFMEESVFDVLKLRGSYGTNGNQDIANGTYSALNATKELYVAGTGYLSAPTYRISQLANPDLKWETSIQSNIGIDFEMLANKFRGSFDIYNKTTTDLYQPVQISAINATTSILANYGEMYNRGVELNLAYDIFKNYYGFNFTLKGNGSYNKNRITDIPNENGFVDNGAVVNAEGHRISEFYLVRYIGVNPANGNLLFLDKDGKPTENPDQDKDRVFTGKSAIPAYQGGFGFDADYKGFFLNTQFSFVADIYRFDYDLAGYQATVDIGTFNKSTDMDRSWTPDNRHTDMPSLFYSNTAADAGSDRYLRDASYLRLKFTTFGYTFSKKDLKKTPFTAVKTYINAENMLTWSKWRGADAESTRSADQNAYPTPKIVSFGLNLEF